MARVFESPEQADVIAKKTEIDAIMTACSDKGGIASCTCASDPDGVKGIADVTADPTETFFCLPNECECKEGGSEMIEQFVSQHSTLSTPVDVIFNV